MVRDLSKALRWSAGLPSFAFLFPCRMAVHLQPFCGKLNRLREQPADAQPQCSRGGGNKGSYRLPNMQPTFRAESEASWPTETREAWHGQWGLCRTMIASYGRQRHLQAGHTEARHLAGQMQPLHPMSGVFEQPIPRVQGDLIRTPSKGRLCHNRP